MNTKRRLFIKDRCHRTAVCCKCQQEDDTMFTARLWGRCCSCGGTFASSIREHEITEATFSMLKSEKICALRLCVQRETRHRNFTTPKYAELTFDLQALRGASWIKLQRKHSLSTLTAKKSIRHNSQTNRQIPRSSRKHTLRWHRQLAKFSPTPSGKTARESWFGISLSSASLAQSLEARGARLLTSSSSTPTPPLSHRKEALRPTRRSPLTRAT